QLPKKIPLRRQPDAGGQRRNLRLRRRPLRAQRGTAVQCFPEKIRVLWYLPRYFEPARKIDDEDKRRCSRHAASLRADLYGVVLERVPDGGATMSGLSPADEIPRRPDVAPLSRPGPALGRRGPAVGGYRVSGARQTDGRVKGRAGQKPGLYENRGRNRI